MLRLFLKNVPEGTIFNNAQTVKLLAEAKEIAGSELVVHIRFGEYQILQVDGSTKPATDVHGFVEWTTQSFAVKQRLAASIYVFLNNHEMNSVITFRDSDPGSFFVNGQLVGKPPTE